MLKRKMKVIHSSLRNRAPRDTTDVQRIVIQGFVEEEFLISWGRFCFDLRTERAAQRVLAMCPMIETADVLCPKMKEARNKLNRIRQMRNSQCN
jgi:hypothetical protein